jgi:hypothetical protein
VTEQLARAPAASRLYTVPGHDFLAANAFADERLAPLTQFAQSWIFEQQHPSSCVGRVFAKSLGHGYGNGIGSHMHVIGTHLSAALERGLIFTYGERAGAEWTDDTTCPGPRNFECFFKRPTSCGEEFITADNTVELGLNHDIDTVLGIHGAWVPSALYRRLRAEFPHMGRHEIKYWWRGQSVAYLMRLNDRTALALRDMRSPAFGTPLTVLSPDAYGDSPHTRNQTFVHALRTAFPFPPGVIGAHIRHGDKHTEMALQPTAAYFDAAAASLVVAQPLAVRRALFISTEDEVVLQQAAGYRDRWVVLHSNIPRANVGPVDQLKALGANRAGVTTRTHLLQLLMALECDAWVTTRGSNWNRLIDELRCIWVDKCKQPVVEIGTPESWADYNW